MKFFVLSKINDYHMHVVQLVLVDLVESLVFFPAGLGTLTLVSVTVTQFTLLAVDSLRQALLSYY